MVKISLHLFFLGCWIPASTAIRRTDRRTFGRHKAQHNVNLTQPQRKLAPVNVEVPTEPSGHLVTDPLPLTKDGEALTIKHWAGHLPVSNDKENYFFYWLFEPETVDENTPLLIWLNGGPACSSMDGLFLENGPIQWEVVDGKFMLQQNPFSWHKAPAYTLYIDQPVGTGLSFTTNKAYPTNDEEINTHFYNFLMSFLKLHGDKFVKNGSVSQPVYFAGESHAGHYIPSMMNFILKKNENGGSPTIPLAGAAIGNGYFDPMHQYAAAEAAYGHGLIGRGQLKAFMAAEQECQKSIQQGHFATDQCYDLQDDIIDGSFGDSSDYRVSSYDVRLVEQKNTPRHFPKNHKVTECYLGGRQLPKWETSGTMDTSVKDTALKAIHASAATAAGQQYQECTDPPFDALADQDGKGVVRDIIEVLEHTSKPRLLFFNGIEDLICNHVGNERALENLPWSGRQGWLTAKRSGWLALPHSKGAAGFMKQHQNLLFLKLFDAGHMVPMDLPQISLRMMKLFLTGGDFNSNPQTLGSKANTCVDCELCPAQQECPQCSTPAANEPEGDCSTQVALAKEEALATLNNTQQGGGDNNNMSDDLGSAPVIGAVVIVAALLVYGVMVMVSRKRQERLATVVTDNVELQPRYRDETEISSNGVI